MTSTNTDIPLRLLTKRQLQQELQVGVTTVWQWMKEGMPHYRRGNILRFDVNQVLSWLEGTRGRKTE